MKRLTRKRFLYVLALIAAHAAAISGGVFFRQQVAHAQMEPEIRYGKKHVDNEGNLVACDCTKPLKECVCQTGE